MPYTSVVDSCRKLFILQFSVFFELKPAHEILVLITSVTSKAHSLLKECGGSEVECLTQDPGIADFVALCPCARHFIPCLALVQPRKTE